MKNGNSNWWFWLVLFLIFGGGLGGLLPLFLMLAVVIGIAGSSITTYRNSSSYTGNRTYRRRGNYQRKATTESGKLARINMYLRRYFQANRSIFVRDNVELRLRDEEYVSLASLDVYRNNAYICSFNDYQRRYPESYRTIIDDLIRLEQTNPMQQEVFDAQVVETPQEEVKKQDKQQAKEKNAQYYIDEINDLNNDIPDEEISTGLYETTSLLKQIQTLETKLPKSKEKLKKLYEYYLPILTKILKQYESLQYAKTDPSYEDVQDKLTRTIDLINDAMEKIISSMTDEDFINLSADISTLEAVLKKDGLTEEGTMTLHSKD